MKQDMNKIILLYVFALIWVVPAAAEITKPKNPTVPTVQGPVAPIKKQNQSKRYSGKEKNKKQIPYSVILRFSHGVELSGTIFLPQKEFTVLYKQKGFIFKKNYSWNFVKYLEVTAWKPTLLQRSKRRYSYRFNPWKYKILFRDGKLIEREMNLGYLQQLQLHTSYGTTSIYSYFFDYWQQNSQKKWLWLNTGQTQFSYPQYNPVERVLVAISFENGTDK